MNRSPLLQSSAGYYDCQLSKARRSHEQLSSCLIVTISPPEISRALLLMTSKVDKLQLASDAVARHNNTS